MKKLPLDQIAPTFILEHNSVKHLIIEKTFFSKKQFSLLSVWFQTHTHKQNTLNHPFPNVQNSWQNQQIVPYLIPVCVCGSIQ